MNIKAAQIEKMFDKIAFRYDLLNKILSFGLDKHWRKKGIKSLEKYRPKNIIDIACGTGDLSITANKILNPDKIIAVDFSENMLKIAHQKIEKLNLADKIFLEKQDCSQLNFPNEQFDAAIIAFGLRNFENVDKSLSEINRILCNDGHLMILEMSVPENVFYKIFYKMYIKLIPFIGKIFAKNESAYRYLPKSIDEFPQNKELINIIEKNGFSRSNFLKLNFEVCTLYTAKKNEKL